MRVRAVVVALGLFGSLGSAYGQAPQPGPEHQQLAYWVGNWKADVTNKESALGPAGREAWTFSFEWFPGRFHLVYRSETSGADGKSTGLGFFGYDSEAKQYVLDEISSSGSTLLLRGVRQDNRWLFTCDQTLSGRPLRMRLVETEVSASELTWVAEAAIDGGPWFPIQEGRATKVARTLR